jgi:hypothetical protein
MKEKKQKKFNNNKKKRYMKKISIDSFARFSSPNRFTYTHTSKRKDRKKREKNDRGKKKEKRVEKNNNNMFFECLSLKNRAILFSHKSSSSSGNAAFWAS